MCLEVLDTTLKRADLADRRARLARRALVGHGLEVLADPQATRIARRASRRQDVVGPGRLVPVRDRRRLAQEERAIVPQPREVPIRVARVPLDVLERERPG